MTEGKLCMCSLPPGLICQEITSSLVPLGIFSCSVWFGESQIQSHCFNYAFSVAVTRAHLCRHQQPDPRLAGAEQGSQKSGQAREMFLRLCYGLNGFHPNSHVEALSLPVPQSVTVFGDRAFETRLLGWALSNDRALAKGNLDTNTHRGSTT